MSSVRFVIGPLALVLAVTLTACVPPRALPPQPTGAELAELSAQVGALQWQYLGLSADSLRPSVEVERYLRPDEADSVYESCMGDAGYHDWNATTGNITLVTNAERLELYRCVSRFPLPPAFYNFYSDAQRAYLYDYYVDQVIPCLSSSEVTIEDVPTRAEYLASQRTWSPYRLIGNIAPSKREQLFERCPDLSGSFFTQ